MHETKLEKRL